MGGMTVSLGLVGQNITKRPAPLSIEEEEATGVSNPRSPATTPSTRTAVTASPAHTPLTRTASAPSRSFIIPQGTPPGSPPKRCLGRPSTVGGRSSVISQSPLATSPSNNQLSASMPALGSRGGPKTPKVGKLTPHAEAMVRRRVTFCPTPKNTAHPITPYGSIYGKHPKLFNF